MSELLDRLADDSWSRHRIEELRDLAFREESDARKHRAEADALELEVVERRVAVNIIREAGLTVDRDPAGAPRVKVERTFAEPGREATS